jgi:2-polyprenyl-3-methyl-5-hydroxy-6-metoxy-1,4-benzoquinol methylase
MIVITTKLQINGPETMHRYAIRGGKEGKERLNLLARVMLPTTSALLERVGLNRGMKCLDAGCGGGHVALFMAGIVGPEGKVIGTDSDREILALARADAEAANLGNIEFHEMDACEGEWDEDYDLVYARFLLSHLNEPQKCLAALVKACRFSGAIVIEDTDFTGSFCYPPRAAYERYVELYQKVVVRRGGDPNIGPKLPGMLRKAGGENVQLNVFQPTHLQGEEKRMAPVTMERIANTAVSEGLATDTEIRQIISGLNDAAADSETVMSLPRVFQVWGSQMRV